MRSACWGARSVLSLITMRPLVVSITIAFCLSRLAGSGCCAIAGKANRTATMKARARIMETPGQMNEGDSFFREDASARKFGLEAGGDGCRHKGGYVAAHGSDLTDQCGGDRADKNRGRNEHGLHVGRHSAVHAGKLHLVIEVGAIAQAPNHDGRAVIPR